MMNDWIVEQGGVLPGQVRARGALKKKVNWGFWSLGLKIYGEIEK
jgi:hypothetical protein